MAAIIAIDQDRPGPSVSSGTPGIARKDLWLNNVIRPRCTVTSGSYAWTLLSKPPGATATITNPNSQTCSFNPDVGGSYRLQLETDGGGPGNVQILILAVTKNATGVTLGRGWRYPALGEKPGENNWDGNTRSYVESLEAILEDIQTNLGGGGGGGLSIAKVCTPEMFGAYGDASHNDQAAFDAVNAAMVAGTYNCLLLGAATYLVPDGFELPGGRALIGHGENSVIVTEGDNPAVVLDGLNSHVLMNFRIRGSGGTLGGPAQKGIVAASALLRAHGITLEGLGGDAITCQDGSGTFNGPRQQWSDIKVVDCFPTGTTYGINVQTSGVTFSNLHVEANNCVKLDVGHQYFQCSDFYFAPATTAVEIAGSGSTAPDTFGDGVINASLATAVTTAASQSQLVHFDNVSIVAGDLNLSANPERIIFRGCTFYSPVSYTLSGTKVTFQNCWHDSTSAYSTAGSNDIRFVNPQSLSATFPTYAGSTTTIAALNIDWALNDTFTKSLSAGSNTITFSNATSGKCISVELVSNVGGSTVTWPAITWAGGSAPTQSSTGTDVYTFMKIGSTIYGTQMRPNAASSSGWQTALDLDFTAETTQSLSTDTTYTIGGKTWTKFNSTNDQAAMVITNGTGLVIQPKSTSDYNGGTRTFPGIYLPISSIASVALASATAVRVTVYISSQNIAANYDSVVFGIDSQSNVCGYAVKYGRGVGAIGITTFVQANSSNLGFNDTTVTLGSTSNVVRMIIPKFGWPAVGAAYAAGAGNVIPTATSFLNGGQINYDNTARNMTGLTPANASLFLGAQRAASGTSLSITISRVVVEYKV